MVFLRHDPARPVRVRLLSPAGYYPEQSIRVPGARMLFRGDLIVSAVHVEPEETHGIDVEEHFSDLAWLSLEETRFLAAIALAVHPERGMAYTYPLWDHVDVEAGLDDEAVFGEVWGMHAELMRGPRLGARAPLPPMFGGPAYRVRDVDAARVLELVKGIPLTDHLLMRGLGALLLADMCWQYDEIREAAVIQLYITLEASFQMVLRELRAQGVVNPSARDAGDWLDAVFNPPGVTSGGYFVEYYEERVMSLHPSNRFGIHPIAPVDADDYYHLRHDLIAVYGYLITGRVAPPP